MTLDLLDEAGRLLRAVGGLRAQLRLVGGLAVRAHVGSVARQTLDIDLVALTDAARKGILEHLRGQGYRVGESGGWWRAIRRGENGARIVDVSPHPVISPRTFDSISLRQDARRFEAGGVDVEVVGENDLATLKLAAGRDQDLVDLMLLCTHTKVDATAVAQHAELDDLERVLASAAAAARVTLESPDFSSLCAELLGRPADENEARALRALLADLKKEGL